jgi:UPF0755 protein
MIRRLVILVVFLVIAAIAVLGGVSYWLQTALTTPMGHDKTGQYIVIEKGSTPAQIIAKLKGDGIIASETPLMIYLRTLGDASKLKAGDYKFASPITPLEVLAELEKGEERLSRLVIPEGFTIFDITKRIDQFQRNIPNLDEVLAIEPSGKLILDEGQLLSLMNDTTLIRDISPEAKNLEGYMYPSTYDIPSGTRPEAIIRKMVEQFKRIWKPDWTAKAKSIGRTPHQIVTIASLIETETGVPAERPIVASVIYNRLSKSIPLGIDMTNIYIAKMQGRWDGTINKSDLDIVSPYNTRKYPGIPPGPISSVSESSIEAALNPATTDYIYYVRNVQLNDGSHHFYASAADFERGKAEYQRWLEKERRLKRANEANGQ